MSDSFSTMKIIALVIKLNFMTNTIIKNIMKRFLKKKNPRLFLTSSCAVIENSPYFQHFISNIWNAKCWVI